LLGDKQLVQDVLHDFRSSGLSSKEKTLFAFVRKVNGNAFEIRPQDIDEAKAAGLTEEALYDAITVCALFNFYNRWLDATSEGHMKPEEFEAGGKRLAKFGYVLS
jgi:alkylhydroperoxidase family enzyme